MAEKRRISNPSTGLRTGIEQGILNDEVRRAEIGRTGNRVSRKIETEDYRLKTQDSRLRAFSIDYW